LQNIIIATSGAGGHLFCGISIAETLRERSKDIKTFFVGSVNNLAKKNVVDKGFIYRSVFSAGFVNKGFFGLVKFVFGQAISFLHSFVIFVLIRPRVIFSTGGFSSMGIVFWGKIFRVPCVVHEQNSVPGKANRIAAKFSDLVLVSFKDTIKFFEGKKCVVSGMPTRRFVKIPPNEAKQRLSLAKDLFTVLVMGGSKGAHGINKIILSILGKFPKNTQFIHLSGKEDEMKLIEGYSRAGINAYVRDFTSEMDVVYSAADAVICRAGSGTLAEVALFGLPAILIPYPYSMDRHQYTNAEFIEAEGAGVVMPEENMDENKLLELLNDKNKLEEMSLRSAKLGKNNAAEKITNEILKYF